MDNREFRRLNRSELVEIIYQLQEEVQKQKEENEQLQKALSERQLKLDQAGSIAEAALAVNQVFEAAERAAEQYLDSVCSLDPQWISRWKEEYAQRRNPRAGEACWISVKEELQQAVGELREARMDLVRAKEEFRREWKHADRADGGADE